VSQNTAQEPAFKDGNDPRQRIPAYPAYQTSFAAAIRKETGLLTGAVGLIRRRPDR